MRFFLLLFVSGFFQLSAQSIVFEKVYDFGLELELGGAVIVENNEYVIGGRTTSRLFNGYDSFRIFKIDSVGNVIWTNENGIAGHDVDFGTSGSLIKTTDEGYVWGGGGFDISNSNYDVIIMKFRNNGDTVFSVNHGGPGFERGYAISETTNNQYALIGQTKSMGDINGDFFLLKTDSNGTYLWDTTYGEIGVDIGLDIHSDSEGGFLLSGGGETNSNMFQGRIIKIDSAGKVLWDKSYGGSYETCGILLSPTKEGGAIFWSCTDSILSGGFFTYFVTKTDSNGEPIWTRYFPHSDYHDIQKVIELDDGGFLFCGRIADPNLSYQDVGWIVRLDNNGNVIWERKYAHSNNIFVFGFAPSELLDIQSTKTNGFIAVGKSFDQTADFWVLKLDSNGCLGDYCGLTDTNCYYQPWPCDTSVGISTFSSNNSLKVYPNPTTDKFEVQGLQFDAGQRYELRLYDVLGNNVRISEFANMRMEVDVSDLESGVYFYSVRSSDGLVQQGKVVVR